MPQPDLAHGADAAAVGVDLATGDSIRWRPHIRVDKYDDHQTEWLARRLDMRRPQGRQFELAALRPYDTVEAYGNLLTTAGLQRLTNLLIGAGGTALTNTTARLGVGNSNTAAAVGQTDLQAAAGAGNRYFMPMDATFPTAVNGVVTLKATWATGDGNFQWQEWCSDIGTATVTASAVVNALMLNRAVQALGTKASGSWVLTSTITYS